MQLSSTCTCTVYMYTRSIAHDIILKLHIKFDYQTYNNSYQLPVRFRSVPFHIHFHSVPGFIPSQFTVQCTLNIVFVTCEVELIRVWFEVEYLVIYM